MLLETRFALNLRILMANPVEVISRYRQNIRFQTEISGITLSHPEIPDPFGRQPAYVRLNIDSNFFFRNIHQLDIKLIVDTNKELRTEPNHPETNRLPRQLGSLLFKGSGRCRAILFSIGQKTEKRLALKSFC
jgi:hypothetical protein